MFAVCPWHRRSTRMNCQLGNLCARRLAKDSRFRREPKMPWISTAVGGCGPLGSCTDHLTRAPWTISNLSGAVSKGFVDDVEADAAGVGSADTALTSHDLRLREETRGLGNDIFLTEEPVDPNSCEAGRRVDPPVARRATMVEPRVEPAGARTWARPDVVAAPTGELTQPRMKLCGLLRDAEEPRSYFVAPTRSAN